MSDRKENHCCNHQHLLFSSLTVDLKLQETNKFWSSLYEHAELSETSNCVWGGTVATTYKYLLFPGLFYDFLWFMFSELSQSYQKDSKPVELCALCLWWRYFITSCHYSCFECAKNVNGEIYALYCFRVCPFIFKFLDATLLWQYFSYLYFGQLPFF